MTTTSTQPPVKHHSDWGRAWAIFFARQILGWIFFMAGCWKVFQLGPEAHVQRFFLPFAESSFLPTWSLWLVGYTVPFLEFLAGAFLLLGWKKLEALVALGFVLIVVTFGHLLDKPLFELHIHVLPRLGLLIFLLMMPASFDRVSLDHWLRNGKR